MRLQGTVALVTGGARRVGRAIVLELARAGCSVAIHYRRSEPQARQLAGEVDEMGRRAVAIHGDLGDPDTWPRLIRETVDLLGRLDILVNNASVFLADESGSNQQLPDSIDSFDADRWERLLRVNLVAPMGLCHHARHHLAARGDGLIINLCDASTHRPWPDHLAYCASKAALECLTKSLARAMAPAVRVNGVAPGIAAFPEEYPHELRRRLTSRVPLGRAGTPEDVARLVRFLVESGDYITGQVVQIDGGRSLI